MNYYGKFDAKVSEALGQHPGSHLYSETVHATHVPSDAIVVSDAQLLFNAEFKRTGVDLVLSGDGREVVLHDYFKGEKHAALASPDGAHLTGDLVNALAGQVQYAQADGNASAGQVIGHVTKLAGTATAIRNGVSIILNNGDNVEKGDVVASGSDSTLGITFIDGTVFGLSSNARMVLNEMVYDPNGSNNSSLLSLVAGTITFVAGETAKHGDMKVDTPVATMGIRGTACLVEIDFTVPGATPDLKFQVLVEPDGTTGSYILFDKTTLTPLAVVDRAGLQINISDGLMSQTLAPLSPEIQKLISDVFTLKFSDTTPIKAIEHFTDSIVPNVFGPVNFAQNNGSLPTVPIIVNLVVANGNTANNNPVNIGHIAQAPGATDTNGNFLELPGVTNSSTLDKATGTVSYTDVNKGDSPTVSAKFASFSYVNAANVVVTEDAGGQHTTPTLNGLELADIQAVEVALTLVQDPADKNNGTATWTYSLPDHFFDFLAAGETLTLTYNATVDNNFGPNDQTTTVPFTITITGTNDVPVIMSSQQNISFAPAGTDTKGGDLVPNTATKGTLNFTDVDLTDTHTVAVAMQSALLNGQPLANTVGTLVLNELAAALTANVMTDSTGTGAGTIAWTLADLEVFLADVIPSGETLVLTYVVTVADEHNATATQDIVVTIGGNLPAATAWIDTTPLTGDALALWSDASNWSTDLVPNSSNDVVINNNQVNPKTPTFPVTVDDAEGAKSLAMNDFSNGSGTPTLDVEANVTLTIAGALNLNTDTATDPDPGPDFGQPLVLPTAEAIINNYGTISVGGIAELLKHSVLNNYGDFVLKQGGDFDDQSSITNSGTIEIVSGTLTSEVGIANSVVTTVDNSPVTVLGTIQVDGGATLKLTDSATITSGEVTLGSLSVLDVEKGAVLLPAGTPDATLDGVTVIGTGGANPSTIEVGTTAPATLLLDDGTTIKTTDLSIAGGSTVDIEAGTHGPGATLNGVAVSGVSGVTPSTIEVGTTASAAAILLLDDGTTITNGNLTIADGSTVDVEGRASTLSPSATLDGVKVTNATTGTVEVGLNTAPRVPFNPLLPEGSVLVLDDGTAITNGSLKIAVGSTVDIESATGATLDGVSVTGFGAGTGIESTISINANFPDGAASTLILDDGTAIKTSNLFIDPGSTLDVESAKGATLDGVVVDDLEVANVSIGAHTAGGSVLTLVDGTTISEIIQAGGSGSLSISGGSTLDIESSGGALLDEIAVTGVSGLGASLIEIGATTAAGSILTIGGGTTITNGNLTIAGGSTLDVEAMPDVGVAPADETLTGATLDGVTVIGTDAAPSIAASTIDVGNTTSGTVLTVDDGTTITNGDLTIAGGSTVDVEAGATGPGATFDGVAVGGASGVTPSTIEVGTTAAAAAILLLDDGTTITNGNLKIAGGSTVDVEAGTTGPGATLDGVAVSGVSGVTPSTIEVGTTASAAAILLLDDGTTIKNGNLKIAGGSAVDVTTSGATLDGVTVTGTDATLSVAASTIEVGTTTTTGTVLTLDDGTTVTNGDLKIDSENKLDIESSTGATLDAVTVVNSGTIRVDGAVTPPATTVTLVLDGGTTITGGDLVIHDPSSSGEGVVEIGTGGATFDDVTVADNNELTIDSLATLTLDDATSITGGKLVFADSSGNVAVGANGATLDGVTVSGGGEIDVGSATATGVTLMLDDSASITNGKLVFAGSSDKVFVGTGGATLDGAAVSGGGEIDVGSVTATGVTLTLDDAASITNGKLVFADSSDKVFVGTNGATLDGTAVSGGGEIDVGSLTDTGVTLTVDDAASITNGKLVFADSSDKVFVGTGGATLNGVAVSGGGTITTGSGVSLTLTNVTLDNVTLSGSFTNTATLTVDSGNTLTLNAAIVSGGTIANNSTASGIVVTTASTIENATIDGGDITATAAALTLTTVTLDDVTLAGSFTNTATLTIDSEHTLTSNGATITGGTINIQGELDTTGNSFITSATIINKSNIDVVSGTLMIDPAPFTNDGTIEVHSAMVFSDEVITNNNGTIQVDQTGTLTLDGSTVDGGTVDNYGTIVLTGDSSFNGLSSFVNDGTLEADGPLTFTGMTINNAGHTLKSGAGGIIYLVNTIINGGTLGGKFATATGNVSSTLNGVTLAFGTLVTAVVGVLELTGTINNYGEIDATSGLLDLSNATLIDGTLGGDGTIATISHFNEFSGVTIASGTTVGVTDGTALDLVGTISNGGTISLDSSGHGTALEISGKVSLTGGGDVTMTDSSHNSIVSDGSAATLTNSDTISGAGTIGDSHLTLVNSGTIDATGSHTLIIDTGSNFFSSGEIVGNLQVTNNVGGVLEASAGHSLLIEDNVLNNGLIESGNPGGQSAASVDVTGNITGTGSIEIFNNSTLEIGGSVSSGQTVTFGAPGGPVATNGLLILDDSHDFNGTIVGLTANSNQSLENQVDLRDLIYIPGLTHAHYHNGEVTVSDFFDSVTLNVSGNSSGSFEVSFDGSGGTLLSDPAASGNVTIDSNQTLDISAASSAAVSFTNSTGNTGELVLDDSKDFTGTVAGFTGDGTTANSDLIDVTDVNIADVALNKTTYTNDGNGTGTLTLYNASGQALDSINFDGNYQLANFTVENDGDGGTLIVDPPVSSSGQTAPHHNSSGTAATDGFVFNFAGLNHAPTTDFHPEADTLTLGHPMSTSLQIASNAAPDNGHLNMPPGSDGQDHIGLNSFLKAHLHAADFHFV